MTQYIGVDIVEIARIERAVARWGTHFLERVFTDSELTLYRKKPWSLAARFAGKEAVVKALGIPYRAVSWKDIEVLSDPEGKPVVHLYGRAQKKARDLGLLGIAISLSHSKDNAVAFAICEMPDHTR